MKENCNRRDFIKMAAIAGAGIGVSGIIDPLYAKNNRQEAGKRIGIIGLDTSHAVAFTRTLNDLNAGPQYGGYKIVAAYPKGSNDILKSVERIPGYTEEVKKMGVEIVSSISELLKKVDVVLLETNDGRLHLEQAMPVIKAGKRLFIDKPIAASLKDAKAIFDAAQRYNVPVFSSSSLRYITGIDDVKAGKLGKIIGAETYSPATLEKTHPDFFWYGIHGVEILFTLMGTGCKQVSRVHTDDTDVTIGVWEDDRIGTFRGTRSGKSAYGGTVFAEKATVSLGDFKGYNPLLEQIIQFFQTGIVPVKPEETLEICAFMEAADESKVKGGASVSIDSIFKKAGITK
ncbi:Gfo/Idh/MocA family oxidoreductase [Pedobacter sp. BS3]|uniref:Gfo/Idh/MocA family protein n=1 Tax=Pedobacter sp. BS3 TaxID=2567937 RepID=UPI0011EE41D8|nr:Gfo/Idh/MocA family oxidoreductase [Pedobacter sp. BS3]TZF81427.1 Gfo/Idh/MocA family oxidoreductase [Pedobacter sp. BS3]